MTGHSCLYLTLAISNENFLNQFTDYSFADAADLVLWISANIRLVKPWANWLFQFHNWSNIVPTFLEHYFIEILAQNCPIWVVCHLLMKPEQTNQKPEVKEIYNILHPEVGMQERHRNLNSGSHF